MMGMITQDFAVPEHPVMRFSVVGPWMKFFESIGPALVSNRVKHWLAAETELGPTGAGANELTKQMRERVLLGLLDEILVTRYQSSRAPGTRVNLILAATGA
jgi:hypothetical protein